MTALALLLATALMLGALHAFDADHLAAVTAFIARRPSAGRAAGFALRWGLGHSTTLLAAGLASALLNVALAPGVEAAAEIAVGAMLIAVGSWVLAGVRRGGLSLSPHAHEGLEHTHLHRPGHSRAAHHSVFWIGALHGLAGSAGLLVIIPVGLMSSAWGVIAYIVTFSLGVTAAMTFYALAIGGLFGRAAGGAGPRWYPWLTGAVGCCTVALGCVWISLRIVEAAS